MASVCLRGRFSPGDDVGLFERTGDLFLGGDPVQTATVSDGSEVEFEGLDAGDPFWVVGGDPRREVRVTAKDRPERRRLSPEETRDVLASTRPEQGDREIVSGARGSLTARALSAEERAKRVRAATVRPEAHEPNEEGARELEPGPRIKQAEVPADQPQRSATPVGEGHPVDPWEIQPRVRQDQVSPVTKQMSATELGDATPIEGHEVQPDLPQEDVGARTLQRSATETGEEEIIDTTKPSEPEPQRKVSSKARAAVKREARKGTGA
jgi:hypothetical protein